MQANLIGALSRMSFHTDPTNAENLSQKLLTCPKAQMDECCKMTKVLQEQKLIQELAIETMLAWEHIREVCAEFPKIFTHKKF